MGILAYMFYFEVENANGLMVNLFWYLTGAYLLICAITSLITIISFKKWWCLFASVTTNTMFFIAAYYTKLYLVPLVLDAFFSENPGMAVEFVFGLIRYLLVIPAPYILLFAGIIRSYYFLHRNYRKRGDIKPLDLLWNVIFSCVGIIAILVGLAIVSIAAFMLWSVLFLVVLLLFGPAIFKGIGSAGRK